MKENQRTAGDHDARLENFAAELTSAAYPLVFQHGRKDSWLKLELGLWRSLAATAKEWARQRPPARAVDEFAAWRVGLLGALTGKAHAIAQSNGVNGSWPEVESGVYQAFRQVIGRYSHVN
jgi:hypothetical protein